MIKPGRASRYGSRPLRTELIITFTGYSMPGCSGIDERHATYALATARHPPTLAVEGGTACMTPQELAATLKLALR
jgi:hypothetical protein